MRKKSMLGGGVVRLELQKYAAFYQMVLINAGYCPVAPSTAIVILIRTSDNLHAIKQ